MEAPFLYTVLESLTEGVFTVDKDWNITSFNRAAEKITGISRQEAIAKKCWEIFHASICKRGCALKKTINTHSSVFDMKIDIKNKQGRIIPVSISTAVLKGWQGKVVGGVETFRDLSAIESLKKEIAQQYTFKDIIGKNHKMQDLFKILPDIAQSNSTVLIQGASGTGKELFARAIHDLSPRKKRPFVFVNCGALPDTLLESELFGYVRGAFTDAKQDKSGRFFFANGGTLFLDEIGDISPSIQVKLLRVLQDSTYEPLGSNITLRTKARIITATNRDLLELIRKESFRDDMYYRISVIRIDLPLLSERMDDIPLLVDHFIKKFNTLTGKKISNVSNEVMEKFMNHDFPGNIRELENIIEHAFVLCREDILELKHLPKSMESYQREKSPSPSSLSEKTLQETEAELIKQTLQKYYGHRGWTARELGIHKTTLWRKMKKYGLEHKSYDSFE
ncbi:MAG: sigma 54-interacting transcriptional regulator [Spirochaetales bacterium]|jgi:PAS domain S-box-containing protein|nr:sigma 54-interacting transcriptional regulator [Spirochaetales bacterium]